MIIEELRIGNLVLFENEIQEISSIHSDNTVRLRKNKNEKCHGCYTVNSEKIKPILLSKETLLNLGYKNIGMYFKIDSNIEFFVNDNKLICDLYDETIYNMDFVHQLQNLHFSLYHEQL
jgi:hypothetical protein